MKTYFISLLIILSLLTGCATAEWTHPTKTASEMEQDKRACNSEAKSVTQGDQLVDDREVVSDSLDDDAVDLKIYDQCMRTLGYTKKE